MHGKLQCNAAEQFTWQGFGIGMGSLSDTYIANDFDATREAVKNAASLVIEAAGLEAGVAK